MEIQVLAKDSDFLEEGIQYFWKCWGNESNFIFYQDCILHSLEVQNALPNFYIALENEKKIGSYALITNDIISRQDLLPWFACLFVEETHRKKGIAEKLLNHALQEAQKMGFEQVYLSTDLEKFYERKGWQYFAQGYNFMGEGFKIYSKATSEGK